MRSISKISQFSKISQLLRWLLNKERAARYFTNIFRYSTNLNRIEIDKPIFLLGTQGCGLTMLMKVFQRHSITCFCRGNNLHWDAAENEMHAYLHDWRIPKEFSFVVNKQYPTKYPTDRFRYWTYALDETLPLYRVDVESITPDISDRFQRVIKRVIRAYAHDPYRARFIDKSQLYTINIEAVKKALNPSTPIFIVVTRNPYAMCKRVAEIYYKSRHKHGFGITTERSIRLCCQHWRNSYEIALAASEKVENIKLYQFEKIILDPEKYIRSMCDFAQLNFEIDILPAPGQKRTLYGSMRSRWYPMRVNVNDNYLNELTGREIDIIYHECGKLAESLGYKKPYKNRKAVLGK